MSETLKPLLAASVELIQLRKQVKDLLIENARLRAMVYRLTDYELAEGVVPALLRPQI